MITRTVFLFAAAVLMAACRGPQVGGGEEAAAAQARANASAAPDAAGKARPSATEEEAAAVAALLRQGPGSRLDYRISPADLVSVTVYEVPEMNRKVRVNASGMVFLPLIGAIEVGGKSMGAAQAMIEKKLASFVVKPQVTLFIEEYGNRRISVMGEVQKPGTYPLPTESRMTVLEAISAAGGFTPVAAPDRARILRFVNGQSVKYTVDVKNLTRGENKEQDMVLEPNDVIFVPQSLF